jgi:hypothetical protein
VMLAPIQLDYAAAPRRFSAAGLIVLVVGAAAAAWTVSDYQALELQGALLEVQVSAASPRASSRTVDVDGHGIEEASAAVAELSLPWLPLLDDLESIASDTRNDVALLSIEPDREKQRVRIGAEARSLPAALEFVQQLQRAGALKFPLLDNHKVRTEQSERPVYFEMTADWRLAP